MQRGLLALLLGCLVCSLLIEHSPAQQQDWSACLDCHTDQVSELPRLSEFRPAGIGTGAVGCVDCHELLDLQQYDDDWLHPVLPVGNHLDCAMCHPVTAHSASLPPPMPKGDYDHEGCYNCHRNVEASLAFAGGHNPFTVGCISCHPPHVALMVQLPPSLVTSKIREDYSAIYDWYGSNAKCLDCHNVLSLIYDNQAGFVTYNTENYHLRHVIEGRVLCVECHAPHGSFRQYMLRDLLLTGEALFYLPQPDGGSCSVNCHGVDHSDWEYVNRIY